MKHLLKFNENSSYIPLEDLEKWALDAYWYIEPFRNIYEELPSIGDNTLWLRYLIDGIDWIMNNKNKCMPTHAPVKELYHKYIQLKKLDISYYEDIEDVLEDICDDNDCSYSLINVYMNKNKLSLNFYLYDMSAEFSNTYEFYDQGAIMNRYGRRDVRYNKIQSDIYKNSDRLKKYSTIIDSTDPINCVMKLRLNVG